MGVHLGVRGGKLDKTQRSITTGRLPLLVNRKTASIRHFLTCMVSKILNLMVYDGYCFKRMRVYDDDDYFDDNVPILKIISTI